MAVGTRTEGEQGAGLESLEERVAQAVTLIGELRREREALKNDAAAAKAQADQARAEAQSMRVEHDAMLAERSTIAKRIEALIGQFAGLDQAGADRD